jgi:hypothetical protein
MPAGSLQRIVSIPVFGNSPPQTLFTVNGQVWSLDCAADGSIFVTLIERPASLWQLTPSVGTAQEVNSLSQTLPIPSLSILPDGRIVVPILVAGQGRLMTLEKGKDPVLLIAAGEEAGIPFCAAGPREIAFIAGAPARQTIGIADVTTGRITSRIVLAKGPITGLDSSIDGKVLYCAAGGVVWAVPRSGGEPRKIREGDHVAADPLGRYLMVETVESSRVRLFQVPLGGGPEREIPIDSPFPIFPFPMAAGSISRDNRMLLQLAPRDSWFNPPGILDLVSGRVTRIPFGNRSDHPASVWMSDGRILTMALGLRSSMWKFTPETSPR